MTTEDDETRRHRLVRTRTATVAPGTRRPIAGVVALRFSAVCECGFKTEWYGIKAVAEAVVLDHVKKAQANP